MVLVPSSQNNYLVALCACSRVLSFHTGGLHFSRDAQIPSSILCRFVYGTCTQRSVVDNQRVICHTSFPNATLFQTPHGVFSSHFLLRTAALPSTCRYYLTSFLKLNSSQDNRALALVNIADDPPCLYAPLVTPSLTVV